MSKLFAIASILCLSMLAKADDAPLSFSTYPLVTPIVDDEQLFLANTKTNDISKNDLMAVLQYQTKVKSQGSRNTCTVFSIVALIESLLRTQDPSLKSVDLSEQWVQYLAALSTKSGGANGSTVPINFAQIQKHGIADESLLKYDPTVWTATTPQATKTCDKLTGLTLTRCLISQLHPKLLGTSDADLSNSKNALYSPSFVKARTSANTNKSSFAAQMDG